MRSWLGLQHLWQRGERRGRSDAPSAPSATAAAEPSGGVADVAARRESLFALFEAALADGARFARLTRVDDLVDRREGAIFLKHDVHDVPLDDLVSFAEREARLGIHGTYFFMPPDHPRTRGTYGFTGQVRAMKEVAALGHEIGLHIDPYFQTYEARKPLAGVLHDLRRVVAAQGFDCRIGNSHGNSVHKHADRNGFATSFDLFEETARQPDYPVLAGLPEEAAALVRANRVRLVDHGFTHWGDTPMWSARHGVIRTNFLTDNWLGTKGSMRLRIRQLTTGQYHLGPPRALLGSRSLAEAGRCVRFAVGEVCEPVHGHFPIDAPELRARMGRAATPLVVLVHPEFYV